MVRPKSFDKEDVLRAAMFLFWKQGYVHTSMKDLEQATRLTPGSIYNEFGSKLNLFKAALNYYIDWIVIGRIKRYLSDDTAPLTGIREFLITVVKDVPENVKGDACFLMNTSVDDNQIDDSVKLITQRGYQALEQGLFTQLERAKATQQVPANLDSHLIAKSLIVFMSGLLVLSKQDNSITVLEDLVNFTLESYR